MASEPDVFPITAIRLVEAIDSDASAKARAAAMALIDVWRQDGLYCSTCARSLQSKLDWHVVFAGDGTIFGAIGVCCADADESALMNSLIDALMADDGWRRRCNSAAKRLRELSPSRGR